MERIHDMNCVFVINTKSINPAYGIGAMPSCELKEKNNEQLILSDYSTLN